MQAIVGKREIWRSLGTDSRTVALRRSLRVAATIEHEFEAARSQAGLTVDETVLSGFAHNEGVLSDTKEAAVAGPTVGELYDAYMGDPTRDWSPTTRMAYQTTRRVVLAILGEHTPITEDAADSLVAMEIKLWLKRRVRLDVREIAGAYEKRFDLKPRSIRVAEFATGWGSCGPSGTIHIDWRLVFAPKRVLEYVVVHELAHLKHRSHGDAFWAFLSSILPDFERPKGWLETHQGSLDASFLSAASNCTG